MSDVAPAMLNPPRQVRAVVRMITAMIAVFCVGITMLSRHALLLVFMIQKILLRKRVRKQKPTLVPAPLRAVRVQCRKLTSPTDHHLVNVVGF